MAPSYPQARMTHDRVLQSFGSPRGVYITPVPGPPVKPPQVVHQHSAVVTSLAAGVVFVVEWTDGHSDLHFVRM